jgi:hypothetical protein
VTVSLELLNTLATMGTFLVIAATAVAAIIQLRHLRSSNQIVALNELRATHDKPDFIEAQRFLLVQLEDALADPVFRRQIGNRAERTSEAQADIAKIEMLGNFYEVMGMLVKTGLIDKRTLLEIWSELAVIAWEKLEPVTAILRRNAEPGIWENFEYLVVVSQDWLAVHPQGTYPAGVRRLAVKDNWLAADAQRESERDAGEAEP